MTANNLCVTLSEWGDGTIRMHGSCIIAGSKWIFDKRVKPTEVFKEMSKLTDECNNELGIGCVFDCE